MLWGKEGTRADNTLLTPPGRTFLLALCLVARQALWTSVGLSWRFSLAAFPGPGASFFLPFPFLSGTAGDLPIGGAWGLF